MAGSGWIDDMNDSKPPIDRAHDHANPSLRKSTSKTAEYFAKIANGDYYCIVCKDRTPSREFIIKKGINGSTTRLWRHLEKAHPAIHRKIRSDVVQPSVADVFANVAIPKHEFTCMVDERTTEELLGLICCANWTFDIAKSRALERLVSYFAQRDVSRPSAETIRVAALKKFKEGKANLRQLLGPVRKVSLTVDAWITKKQVPLLGIAVHWVDDTWALCERVLGVEEMVGPETSDSVAEVLIRILKDYSLMDKVCIITTNNASKNSTMITSLARSLKDIEVSFNKQYHMPCLAHIINLVVQEGLEQLGILPAPSLSELVEEYEVTTSLAQPSKASTETTGSTLGTLIGRLRLTIVASQGSPKSIALYKVLCKELGMPDKKQLVLDFGTKWNSTYEMLVSALKKRQVLDKMAIDSVNGMKDNYLITTDEWELLKIFVRALLPFHYCIELISKSKMIFASTALRILEALLSMMVSYISDLDTLSSTCSAENMAMLKGMYMSIKEKLVMYVDSLKRNPTFAIAVALDPQMKLGDTLSIEHDFVYENILRLVNEVENETTSNHNAATHERDMDSIIQSLIDGTLPKGFNLIDAALKCSQPKVKRLKRSVREELDVYFDEACIDDDSLNWWGQTGCYRFPQLSVLAKEFLSICAASTSLERMFAAGLRIVPYKRGSLDSKSASALMTLKCWAWEEDPEDHAEEDEQSNNELDE